MTAPDTLNEEATRPQRILELITPKLAEVEEELRRNFRSEIRTITEVGEHVLGGGGKRLRPALLLVVSRLLGYEGKRDITYGAVVEFIHTATLIHDDIIDEAELRRGRKSVNYGWGNNLTVLVGDHLFMHAMSMALDQGDLNILRLLSDVTLQMIEGEILGLEQSGRVDLTFDEYFAIVERKTAALFGASCRIPGYLVGASERQAAALIEYGRNLGICFQLVDDILDYVSSTEVLGKPTVSDLKEGKVTLPLILALPRMSEAERATIARIATSKSFDGSSPEEVLALVNRYDGVREAREIARTYADRARAALQAFPPSDARDALELALDFVMDRDR